MPNSNVDLSQVKWDDEVKPSTSASSQINLSQVKWDDEIQPSIQSKPKELLDIMAGGTPEEFIKQGNWVGAGIQQTGKDLMTVPAHFFNQMMLNYPRYLTEKAGMIYPEKAQSPIAQKTAQVAGVAGGLKNPLLKVMGVPATAGKLAAQGALTGAIYAPEDTKTMKEDITARGTQAALGTIIPISVKGVGKVVSSIPKASRFMSGRIVNSLIKPVSKDFSYGKNPGLGVAREGIIANNMDDLVNKISNKTKELGQNIKQTLTTTENLRKRLSISNATDPIDKAMEEAAINNNKPLLDRLTNIKSAITDRLSLGVDQKGNNIIVSNGKRKLTDLSPLEATEIKSAIGKMASWTGNPTDDKATNKAIQETYRIIKNTIGNTVPEIKPLNERYANILSAEIAVNHRNQILQRQNMISFAPKLIGGGGALYGLSAGNPGIVLASIATIGVDKLLESPAAKTRLAVGLNKMSNMNLSKVISKYPKLQNLITKSGGLIRQQISEPYFSK